MHSSHQTILGMANSSHLLGITTTIDRRPMNSSKVSLPTTLVIATLASTSTRAFAVASATGLVSHTKGLQGQVRTQPNKVNECGHIFFLAHSFLPGALSVMSHLSVGWRCYCRLLVLVLLSRRVGDSVAVMALVVIFLGDGFVAMASDGSCLVAAVLFMVLVVLFLELLC